MPSLIGRPPINPVLFILGKVALAFSLVVLVLRLAGVDLLGVTFEAARLPALVILIAGVCLILGAIRGLGNSARVGLPGRAERTGLRTTGLYAFTRNPIYVAGIAVCAASAVYVPHWLNIVATLTTAFVHHKVVFAEERFLHERFGAEWDAYRARVRRYL